MSELVVAEWIARHYSFRTRHRAPHRTSHCSSALRTEHCFLRTEHPLSAVGFIRHRHVAVKQVAAAKAMAEYGLYGLYDIHDIKGTLICTRRGVCRLRRTTFTTVTAFPSRLHPSRLPSSRPLCKRTGSGQWLGIKLKNARQFGSF